MNEENALNAEMEASQKAFQSEKDAEDSKLTKQTLDSDDILTHKQREIAQKVERVKGGSDGKEAKKDQELVLYEFLNMLVRIGFWRSNPNFGLHGNKDELVPVPDRKSVV